MTDKQQQLDALRAVAQGLPATVRMVGEPWVDDHILCCKLGILLGHKQPEIEVELLWVGWQGIAAIKYAHDSREARADLIDWCVAPAIESLEEEIAEELDHGGTCPN